MEAGIGKLFKTGRSQAIRLPKEFRFQGDKVRLKRVGRGVLIEPLEFDVDAWFAEMARIDKSDFMNQRPEQPPIQERGTFD